MRKLISVLALCVLTSANALGAEAKPPTEQSLKRLLAVTEVRNLLDGATKNIDASIDASIRQSLEGKPINEQGRKVLDAMRGKMAALVRESLAWEKMEPMFMDIYSRSLTQSEVDGMLAFYETEAGKALVAKMPLIMQNTMQVMQSYIAKLAPQMMQIEQETLAKLKAGAAAP
jgi:hypothetical protein